MTTADDLLRHALDALNWLEHPLLIKEIRAYLSDASPSESINTEEVDRSKDEPVAWIPEDELPERYPYNFMFQYSKVDIIRWFPVYGPPTKTTPMTIEEINSKFALDGSMFSSYTAFKQGVRLAERHHGIGGGDE